MKNMYASTIMTAILMNCPARCMRNGAMIKASTIAITITIMFRTLDFMDVPLVLCEYKLSEKWEKYVGLVRFELTIDGSLRTLEEFKENTKSVLQRLFTDPPRRTGLSRPVAHHFLRWSPSPFLTRPQPLRSIPYVCSILKLTIVWNSKMLKITLVVISRVKEWLLPSSPQGIKLVYPAK
jgi:hypothetical protein